MIVFESVQKHYATLGITSSHQWTQKFPLSPRVLLGFLLFAYLIVSQLVYIFFVADDFMEYVECVTATSGSSIIFVCFMAIVFRKETMFKCIAIIEKFIDTS